MALRLIKNISSSFQQFTYLHVRRSLTNVINEGNSKKCLLQQATLPILFKDIKLNLMPVKKNEISFKENKFIDLFTNNAYKRLYMPTITINTLKVYEDSNTMSKSIEDNRKIIKIIDPFANRQMQKKEAIRMIRIRRRKMKKHKLIKFRKRMKFVIAKMELKRQLRKEQAFRAELLTQVEAAEKFDAKEYVEKILHTLRYHPKPDTREESWEKYRLKMKAHRYQTSYIKPSFKED